MKKNPIKAIAVTTMATIAIAIMFTNSCKKSDSVTPIDGVPVSGAMLVDTTWILDRPHSNVIWETRYYDYSDAMLIGRFINFYFVVWGPIQGTVNSIYPSGSATKGKFIFDETNMSKCMLECWVRTSTFNTGEPLRDGNGLCGPSYVGVTYLDSMKTIVNNATDTAWFRSTSFAKSGTGYVVKGNFTFNHYRPASGFPDLTPITKPVTMYLTYQGTRDFDSNGDGILDKYRAGFTGKFSFLRSDYFDNTMTKAYILVPNAADAITNATIAANNKTYGNWSKSVGDKMDITINLQVYKNH